MRPALALIRGPCADFITTQQLWPLLSHDKRFPVLPTTNSSPRSLTILPRTLGAVAQTAKGFLFTGPRWRGRERKWRYGARFAQKYVNNMYLLLRPFVLSLFPGTLNANGEGASACCYQQVSILVPRYYDDINEYFHVSVGPFCDSGREKSLAVPKSNSQPQGNVVGSTLYAMCLMPAYVVGS